MNQEHKNELILEEMQERRMEAAGAFDEEKKIPLDLSERASDDLLIAAFELQENGIFSEPSDMLHFFEKPHHWTVELKDLGYEVL